MQTKFNDVRIARQMDDVITTLSVAGDEFVRALEAAHLNHETIGDQLRHLVEAFPGHDVSLSVTDIVEYPDDKLYEAQQELKSFDKALIKLLALRLRLAQETGIPLNLSGGKNWVRLVDYSL